MIVLRSTESYKTSFNILSYWLLTTIRLLRTFLPALTHIVINNNNNNTAQWLLSPATSALQPLKKYTIIYTISIMSDIRSWSLLLYSTNRTIFLYYNLIEHDSRLYYQLMIIALQRNKTYQRCDRRRQRTDAIIFITLPLVQYLTRLSKKYVSVLCVYVIYLHNILYVGTHVQKCNNNMFLVFSIQRDTLSQTGGFPKKNWAIEEVLAFVYNNRHNKTINIKQYFKINYY